MENPTSLVGKVFKAKYFPNSFLLEAGIGNNTSYVWRSILRGRKLLMKGIRWRVVTGSNISIFKCPRQPRPYSFKPITVPNSDLRELKVSDLITKPAMEF